jgi:hypothetical protein
MYFSYKGFLFKELSFELLFIPSPTKLRRDIDEAMTLKINRVSDYLKD